MTDTLEAESYLAGAVCHDQKTARVIAKYLDAEDFRVKPCGYIISEALESDSRGQLFDGYIAADALRGKMADPRRFVAECMDLCPTTANVEEYAKLVRREADERKLRQKVTEALQQEHGEALTDTIAGICADIIQHRPGSRMKKWSDVLRRTFMGMYEDPKNRIDTGYGKLDAMLKGMWGKELIILAARPAVGKSAFVQSIAENVARSGKVVHYYTLEMADTDIVERGLSKWTNRLTMGDLIDRGFSKCVDEWKHKELAEAAAKLSDLPIYIDDSTALKPSKIRAQALTQEDLGLIVVDYGGLMRSEKKEDNRYHELGSISRDLKNLASELDIPVIMLAQLNRGVSDTAKPTLRELRDSGNLEENANKCIFLWNVDKEAGKVGVSVAKNRRGKTGEIVMQFDGDHMRFMETEDRYEEPSRRKRYEEVGFNDDDE